MSQPAPRRNNRIWLAAGIGILAVCLLALGLFSLLSLVNLGSAPEHARPTIVSAQISRTPARTEAPAARPTNSGMPTPAPALTSSVSGATPMPAVTATSSAQVATGDLHFDYPLTLLVDKDDIIKVEIVPAPSVVLAGPLNASAAPAKLLVESGGSELAHKTVSYAIPLYPVMSAELATARSQDLVIVTGSESRQQIAPHESNFWTWSLVAKRGGEYRVTLRIFGYNSLADNDPVRTVVDDTRIVNVQDRSPGERIAQGLEENWLVIFGAGGPIALVVLILTLYFSRRDQTNPAGK